MLVTYTVADLAGVQHEAAGVVVTSLKQKVESEAESEAAGGAAIGSFIALQIQHNRADLAAYGSDLLARFGIERTVEDDPPPPEPGLPDAIPMHRAKKALAMLGPEGEGDDTKWLDMVQAAIDAVENPVQRRCIQIEFDTAPNLVLAGATTLMIMAAIGMTPEQRDAMATFALTLP